MKKSHFLLALVSAVCLTFTGCKKNKEESPSPDSETLTQFFEKHEVKEQSFTINVDGESSVITGEQGTQITFPQSAFVTQNGTPATGQITITLTEIYNASDMVLSNRPTTSNGQLLESGGEVYVAASLNGEPLRLAHRKNILLQLPASEVEDNMQLFTGSLSSGVFNWTPLETKTAPAPLTPTWTRDSLSTSYYDQSNYIFSVTKLGWINCDRFYSIPNKTKIEVEITNRGDMEHTTAYLVFKDINSVSRFYEHSSEGHLRSGDIPVGEKVTIVAFSLKNGKEYFAMKEITITEDLFVHIDLEETTEEMLLTSLENLN